MNKLLIVLVAGMFALASAVAMAQVPSGDKTATPTPTPEEQAKMKAERQKAKASRAKMTEEQKQAKRKKKNAEMSQIEKVGNPNAPAKAQTVEKATKASEAQPKALPDAKARQEA